MAKYEPIAVTPKSKQIIKGLSKKFDLNIVKFVEAMCVYFDATGLDPREQKQLSINEEMNKLIGVVKKMNDTTIGFFRTQEKEYIKPVFGKVDVTMARFFHYIENEAPKDSSRKVVEIGEISAGDSAENNAQNEASKFKILDLKSKLSQQELINQKVKEGVSKIFEKSAFKSTGLTKKIVVDMSQHDFDEIKNWLNRM